MRIVLGYIVLGAMAMLIARIPRPPGPESAAVDRVIAGALQNTDERSFDDPENEDIAEPEMSWREANCVPKYYQPPGYLCPDPWHPGNVVLGLKSPR